MSARGCQRTTRAGLIAASVPMRREHTRAAWKALEADILDGGRQRSAFERAEIEEARRRHPSSLSNSERETT